MPKKGEPMRYWTTKEDRLLAERASECTLTQLAGLLGRTPSSVWNHCYSRGIKLADSRTTEEGRSINSAVRASYAQRRRDIGLMGLPKPGDAELMAILDDEFEL